MSAMEIAEGSMSLMAEENKSQEMMAQVSVLQQLVDRISSPPISELLGKLKLDEGLKTDLQSLDAILDDVESMAYREKLAWRWLDKLTEVGYDLEDLLDKIATEILSHQLESKPWNIETCLEKIRDQLENISSDIKLLLQRGKYDFGSSEASWILMTSPLDPQGHFGVQSLIYGKSEEEKYGRREGIKFFPSCEASPSWIFPPSRLSPEGNFEAKSRIYGGCEEKKIGRREDKELYGLRESSRILRKPHPLSAAKVNLEDESQVDGRDEDKNTIIELLLSDNQTDDPVTVIPIVGVVGVGKTTLARLVYNDYRVTEQFDLKGWASLSPILPFHEALIKAFSKAFSIVESRNIGVKLREILNMKKFLLVLDDVVLDVPSFFILKGKGMIQSYLSKGAKGSKILLTANSFPRYILRNYDLKPLNSRVSWMLFVKHAFADKEIGLHPGLEAIGKNIVTKCDGLPLLIVTLGAMLRFKPSVEEWKAVLRKVSDSDVQNDIGSILWMSYNSLPPNLKRCFAYCSIFPKDHEYDKEKLVLLWMAEGFLQRSKHRRIEEVGHEYFDELTSRSFFQKSGANSSRFVLHSLMHKLAQFASGFFCFSFVNSMNESDLPSEVVRHLSLSVKSYKKLISCNTSHLRTLFLYYLSPGESSTDLGALILERAKNWQCLRVLSFSDDTITELPDSIGALKLLQYLDLSHTKITRLPDFVTTLYNLQTLLLSYCRSLAELPTTLMKLAYLRHLDIKETCLKEMPAEMGCLTNLQSLSDFVVGEFSGSNIRELGPLKSLGGTLRISRLQNVVSDTDAAEADLKSKAYLKVLELKWSDATAIPQHATNVLEKLEPHRNLEKLSIISYNGMSFPDWVGDSSFSKVVFLHLSDCNSCSHLPPLGQLPSLKELIIEGMRGVKKIGPEFFGVNNASANPFPSLEILVFREMPEWEGWIPSEMQPVEFPCLKRMHIESCPKYEDHCFPPSVEVEISVSEDTSKELHLPDSNVVQPSEQSSTSKSPPSESPQHLTEDSSAKHGGASDIFDAATKTSSGADNSEDGREGISGPEQESWNPPGASNDSSAASDTDYSEDSQEDISSPEQESINVSQFEELKRLKQMPCSVEIEACDAQFLPADLNKYNNLQHLYFINCHLLKSIQANQLPEALKSLYIRKCKEVKFPFTAERHNSLENLCIESSCDSLVSFPLAIFPQLRSLSIWDCANFNSLLITEDHKFLDALEIRNCAQFISFPEEKLHIPSLTSILLSKCENLKVLPGQLHGLKSLQSLLIDECPEAESVPEGGLPSSLNLVSISFCRKLTPCIEWGLHELNDLSRIEIEGGSEDLKSFPEQNLLPRNLISLRISRLPNLEVLDYKGLQHLTCLETLKLNRCNKLHSLPDEGLPSSLSYLYISDCPLLNSELQNRRGKEWIKIAQIPHIQIDGKVIS